ncbi:unnamed protein product [Trichobilharzia szidati]|nr:unnamed protein product [Trichobilharzia szidati]
MVKTRNNNNNNANTNSNHINNITEDSMDDFGGDETGSPYTSGTDRKRRRGVIEKRRRDRINCSLADLKRLVPDSNYKPGSAKLEKAEILQLTVEFLQKLHKDGHVLGSEARAVELRRIGFKDCLLEVTRLLSTYDGVNISGQELTRHLLSHLYQCEKQRDTEAKTYLANIAAVANSLNQTSTKNTHYPHQQYYHSLQGNYISNELNNSNATKSKSAKINSSACEHLEKLNKLPTTDASLNPSQIKLSHQTYPYTNSSSTSSSFYTNGGNAYTPYHHYTDYHILGQQNPFKHTPKAEEEKGADQLSNFYFQSDSLYPNYDVYAEHNPVYPTGMGPNESQSTSSPPFRSTPDDSDIGFSPHLKNNLSGVIGNDEIEEECGYYTRECTGHMTVTLTSSTTTMTTPSAAKTLSAGNYQESNYLNNNYDYTYPRKNDVCMNLSADYHPCSPVKSNSIPMHTGDVYPRHLTNTYNSNNSNNNIDMLYPSYTNESWRQINTTTDLVQHKDYAFHSHLPSAALQMHVHRNPSTESYSANTLNVDITPVTANTILEGTCDKKMLAE